jgi:hypothetical protein
MNSPKPCNAYNVILGTVTEYLWSLVGNTLMPLTLTIVVFAVTPELVLASDTGSEDISLTVRRDSLKSRLNDELEQSERDPQQYTADAVSAFYGFYLANTRTRAAYCAGVGVPIDSFVNEFKKVNQQEYAATKRLTVDPAYKDKVYQTIQAPLTERAKQNFKQWT